MRGLVMLGVLAACRPYAELEVVSVSELGAMPFGLDDVRGGYSARVDEGVVWVVRDGARPAVFQTPDVDAADGVQALRPAVGVQALTDVEAGAGGILRVGPVVHTDEGALLAWELVRGEGRWRTDALGQGFASWDGHVEAERPVVRPDAEVPTTLFDGDAMLASELVLHEGLLYAFGCAFRGFGNSCHLGRVAPGAVQDPAAWSYWDGARWQSERGAAVNVVGAADALSVHWVEEAQHWIGIYSDPFGPGVVVRTARRLTGPWSAEIPLFEAEEGDGGERPYGALGHAAYHRGDGEGWTELVTYHRALEEGSELRMVEVAVTLPDGR